MQIRAFIAVAFFGLLQFVVADYADRTAGAVLAYYFPNVDCAAQSDFTPIVGGASPGDMAMNSSSGLQCLDGNGIEHDPNSDDQRIVLSGSTAGDLYTSMSGATGVSVEVWFRPHEVFSGSPGAEPVRPIAVLGATPAPTSACSGLGIRNVDLGVYQSSGINSFSFIIRSQQLTGGCKLFQIPVQLLVDVFYHFVVTFTGVQFNGYYNGNMYTTNPLIDTFSASTISGFDDTSKLSFMSDYNTDLPPFSGNIPTPFVGDVYFYAVYPFALSQAEANANYAAKLPNTPGVAVSSSLQTINEDGFNNSLPTEYGPYEVDVPVEYLDRLIIDISDYDLDSTGIGGGGLTSTDSALRIISFHNQLQLYDADTLLEITQASLPYNVPAAQGIVSGTNAQFPLLVRPADDLFSANLSHTFYVTYAPYDVIADLRVIIGTTASATFTINSVNDPAIPDAQAISCLAKGLTTITLTASDIDSVSGGFVYHIVSVPADGVLKSGATVISGPMALSSPVLSYTYTGPEVFVSPTDPVGFDSFSFRVMDQVSGGVYSKVATIDIDAFSSLSADPDDIPFIPASAYTLNELGSGSDSEVDLYAIDLSSGNKSLELVLNLVTSTFPANTVFSYMNGSNQVILDNLETANVISMMQDPADISDADGQNHIITLTIASPDDFFTCPSLNAQGGDLGNDLTLTYLVRLAASSVSTPTESRSIVVVNDNEETVIALTLKDGLTNAEVDASSGKNVWITLSDIADLTITDVDDGADRIKAHVETSSHITVDITFKYLFQPNCDGCPTSCCECQSNTNERCSNMDDDSLFGDDVGIWKSELTMTGMPSEIFDALNSLRFGSLEANSNDTVEITLSDGDQQSAFDGCVDWTDVFPQNDSCESIRSDCFETVVMFDVVVGSLVGGSGGGTESVLGFKLPIWGFALIVLGIFCGLSAFCGYFGRTVCSWIMSCVRGKLATEATESGKKVEIV